jgi:hypothetical protein
MVAIACAVGEKPQRHVHLRLFVVANEQDSHLVIFDSIYRRVKLSRRRTLRLIVALSH